MTPMTEPSGRPRLRSLTPLLLVADIPRSLAFYVGALGFRNPSTHGEPPVLAMLHRDGLELMLRLAVGDATVRPNGPSDVWDLVLGVADLAAEQHALTAAGVRLASGPVETAYEMREIEVLDPDGYRICIAQDIHRDVAAATRVFSGTLDLGPRQLPLVLRLAPSGEGFAGRLDSPEQGVTNLALDSVAVEGTDLRFAMHELDAEFSGAFTDGGKRLVGTWTQRGRQWPLELTREG